MQAAHDSMLSQIAATLLRAWEAVAAESVGVRLNRRTSGRRLRPRGVDWCGSRAFICGQCTIGGPTGRPDHRGAVLTALERERADQTIPCVSRALDAELTLDL